MMRNGIASYIPLLVALVYVSPEHYSRTLAGPQIIPGDTQPAYQGALVVASGERRSRPAPCPRSGEDRINCLPGEEEPGLKGEERGGPLPVPRCDERAGEGFGDRRSPPQRSVIGQVTVRSPRQGAVREAVCGSRSEQPTAIRRGASSRRLAQTPGVTRERSTIAERGCEVEGCHRHPSGSIMVPAPSHGGPAHFARPVPGQVPGTAKGRAPGVGPRPSVW